MYGAFSHLVEAGASRLYVGSELSANIVKYAGPGKQRRIEGEDGNAAE